MAGFARKVGIPASITPDVAQAVAALAAAHPAGRGCAKTVRARFRQ